MGDSAATGKGCSLTAAPAFAVLGLAITIAVAGCGGDDSRSREEFISEAGAICEEYDQRVDQVEEPESVDEMERYVNEVRPVVEDGFNQLEELQPPEELEERWDELMASKGETLEVLDDLDEAAAKGDLDRMREIIEEASRREEESDRIARAIGLQECGGDSGVSGS
jgi:hypothetical protein